MKFIPRQASEAARWAAETFSQLSFRGDRAPIGSVDRVFEFVSTRSALVTQKKLYGYLKERIGLRYPQAFEDTAFARSIDVAKMHVFAAALSDLTVFATARVGADGQLGPEARRAFAFACYRAGVASNEAEAPDPDAPSAWCATFEQRVERTQWENIAAGASVFTESPKALVKWAPIADDHKRYDREIVENSMRFAWNEIVQDFRRRLDPDAVAKDWNARPVHA